MRKNTFELFFYIRIYVTLVPMQIFLIYIDDIKDKIVNFTSWYAFNCDVTLDS
jgi:hypothetical protein